MIYDALILAQMLNCPIWTADGKTIQTPEQMDGCAEKIKKLNDKQEKSLVRAFARKPGKGLLLGIVFFAVALSFSYFAFVEPMILLMESKSWVKCPATVTRSAIKEEWETEHKNNTPH